MLEELVFRLVIDPNVEEGFQWLIAKGLLAHKGVVEWGTHLRFLSKQNLFVSQDNMGRVFLKQLSSFSIEINVSYEDVLSSTREVFAFASF